MKESLPPFHPQKKYTIHIVTACLDNTEENAHRLASAVTTAVSLSQGFVDVMPQALKKKVELNPSFKKYSIHGGCPECGFSWPNLDSRYFSQNSLGRCPDCEGFGSPLEDDDDLGVDSHLQISPQLQSAQSCDGTGLEL